jgi:hypothetical protein
VPRPARSGRNTPIARSSASASTRRNTRRKVSICGARNRPVTGCRRARSAASTPWGASAAHSPIARTERDPASTAAAAIANTTATECRTPRRFRGSGTRPSTSSNRLHSAASTGSSSAVAAVPESTAKLAD